MILLLLVVLLPAVPVRAAEPRGARVWVMADGTRRTGEFVELLDAKLVIREQGKEVALPVEWLAAASLELAKEIAASRAPELIQRVLAMEYLAIPPGKFDMGAPKDWAEMQVDEPGHPVRITRGFKIKKTEVTWSEWNLVRDLRRGYNYDAIGPGRNGYRGDESGGHPVTEISWWDAVLWCNLKSELVNRKPVYHIRQPFDAGSVLMSAPAEPAVVFADWEADGYRLPTEAEWEYAWWRAGRAPRCEEPDGWHFLNSDGNTHPARSRDSNTSKELHDMLGNVAEWCWDWRGPLVRGVVQVDPRGARAGLHRIYRGGSWADDPWGCRPSYRGAYSPVVPSSCFVGFRPVCGLSHRPANRNPAAR